MPRINIVGEKFNRLTIIEDLGLQNVGTNGKLRYVKAVCDCGEKVRVSYGDIKGNKTKSCGCYNKQVASERMTTHGKSDTRIYSIWKDMRRRCNNPKRRNYKDYGGRGISVCDEWDSFLEFYNWSIENGYEDYLSIDRIDSNGNYNPENCRWANSSQQNSNTRKNKSFKATSPEGIVFLADSQADFSREHNLDRKYINSCLIGKQNTYKGWKFVFI